MFTQDGLFKQFDADYDFGYQYQRFNYRANIDLNVTKTTLLSVNVSGKVDDKDSPRTGQGSGGMIKAIYKADDDDVTEVVIMRLSKSGDEEILESIEDEEEYNRIADIFDERLETDTEEVSAE